MLRRLSPFFPAVTCQFYRHMSLEIRKDTQDTRDDRQKPIMQADATKCQDGGECDEIHTELADATKKTKTVGHRSEKTQATRCKLKTS